MAKQSKLEGIIGVVSDSSKELLEVSVATCLLGLVVSVAAYKSLADFVEKTAFPKRYAKREKRNAEVLEQYISGLKEASNKIRAEESSARLSGYFSKN
ncbi:MAG: hypothetical protein V1886_00150 [archaeon]